MAIVTSTIQEFLAGEDSFRSESGDVGRASVDGTLVIYDPNDVPGWLQEILTARDEDGNVERQAVR